MKTDGGRNGIFAWLSFIALILVATLIVVNNFLPLVGVNITGALFNVLETIKNICIILVIGVYAFRFVENKGKGLRITFWIAVAVFIVGTGLVWIPV